LEIQPVKPDFLIITEHGLNSEQLKRTHIADFKLSASYSREVHKWGGVAIYTKENTNIKIKILDTSNYCQEKIIEIAAAELDINKEKVILIGLYRSPSESKEAFYKNLDDFLNKYTTKKNKIIIMGDPNLNILNEQERCEIESFLEQHSLNIHFIPYTRITENSISSIDCCYSNYRTNEVQVRAISNTVSDHHGIQCKILNLKSNTVQIKKAIRKYTEDNLNTLKKSLGKVDWSAVFEEADIDKKYNNFISILQSEIYSAIPSQTVTLRNKPSKPFWDSNIWKLKKLIDTAHNKYCIY